MKLLFIAIIALVIPVFFVFVFVMSTVNQLTQLRDRCRDARQRIKANAPATPPSPPTTSPDPARRAEQEYHLTVEQYNLARKRFPASLLAPLCGFRDVEPLPREQKC